MRAFKQHPIWCSFLTIVLLLTVLGLQGCIHATYESEDGTKVSVTAFNPVGINTEIEAKADGDKKTLSINRETGSAEGLVSGVVDAAVGLTP